jgi:hypothetical protein
MEEIAATFGGIGLPPQMFAGAAEVYRYVSEATAGDSADDGEAEDRLRQVVEALARALP